MSDGPHKDTSWFRFIIGFGTLAGALAGFGALYVIEIPTGNRDAMMLALGIVMGWGSSVVASEYGATSTGRKVVDSAVRNIERQAITADANAQLTPGEPTPVEVVNTPDNPANVKDRP